MMHHLGTFSLAEAQRRKSLERMRFTEQLTKLQKKENIKQ
jgi:hypothetical protein